MLLFGTSKRAIVVAGVFGESNEIAKDKANADEYRPDNAREFCSLFVQRVEARGRIGDQDSVSPGAV